MLETRMRITIIIEHRMLLALFVAASALFF